MAAQTLTKVLGLAVTYVVFEFTTRACKKPVAHLIQDLQRRSLSDIIADAVAYLEQAGYSMMMRTPKQPKGALPEQPNPAVPRAEPGAKPTKPASPGGSPKPKIPLTELCDRCLDTFATVERLRGVAAEMKLPYLGDDVQPCSLCRDRAHRLYDLERTVLMSPVKSKGIM
uniref:Uncharacterized protein n=1 Tax=Hemiselmis andersenii TaxID=464988 RepID=A0A6U2BL85_HEMAN|mmetsp:Transcript_16041/g.37046  ORF Transcript_16041/g.37046 Transcript_16041/m.37046 type:complete len:170 (-) Transcript_16041:342-851(-)|eukprot:CAMPEP_0114135864 /NCGR_PEP_ID=MMETSP0043_2-20121206/14912_1 /TAXON_ID=464988 /ORGANISM="Hemiselmis andersenii, Strain CCMP644" /LENGTH=169 /DNA_ID=CAMNT_0001229587 /DNA_START=219 /DNA_END=728 /DNA_ORIENTATION=+